MIDAVVELALRHRLVNEAQVRECLQLAQKIRSKGVPPKPLVTLLQLKGYLHPVEINGLIQAIRETVEKSRVPPDEMALAERAVRKGFTTVDRVHECVATREQFIKLGLGVKSLADLMVHNGYVTEVQLASIRR